MRQALPIITCAPVDMPTDHVAGRVGRNCFCKGKKRPNASPVREALTTQFQPSGDGGGDP